MSHTGSHHTSGLILCIIIYFTALLFKKEFRSCFCCLFYNGQQETAGGTGDLDFFQWLIDHAAYIFAASQYVNRVRRNSRGVVSGEMGDIFSLK